LLDTLSYPNEFLLLSDGLIDLICSYLPKVSVWKLTWNCSSCTSNYLCFRLIDHKWKRIQR